MTPEEITALAREYAGEIHYGDNFFENENKRFLAWLTRRYCLVEKSSVAEEYKRVIETNREGEETGAHILCAMGSAQKILLESLFPDLGKEME